MLAVLVVCNAGPEAFGEVRIARNGKALVSIIRPPLPIPAETRAVQELTDYLSKVTGATFKVIDEKEASAGTHAIYVGHTAFARKQGIDVGKLAEEESVIRTVAGSLIITGGRSRGTLYGVYVFLEEILGCRWYTPWYEKVPTRPGLTIGPVHKQVKPHFTLRDGGSDFWRDERTFADKETFKRFDEQLKWYLVRNRINGMTYRRSLTEDVGGCYRTGGRLSNHSFFAYVPADKYFKDHPEYFSERNGKRVPSDGHDGNHLCLTNPNVLDIVIAGVREDIQANPDGDYVSVSINDGGSATICDCKNCRTVAEREGESGLLLSFVNRVADAIKDKHPDKYIVTLAYTSTQYPPKRIAARDNVIVWVCKGPRSSAVYLPMGTESRELETMRQWTKHARHVWLWDYGTGSFWPRHFFKPMTWKMDQQFKLARRLKVIDGIFMDHHNVTYEEPPTQFYELDAWAYAKLCQDPGLELDGLIGDFLAGYYGRAAPHLKDYLNLVRDGLPKFPYQFFDYAFVSRAQACFDRAEQTVKDDPEQLWRVRTQRIALDAAALAYRNDVVRSYLSAGGAMKDYPFKLATIRDRALSYIKNSRYPCYQTLTTLYSRGDKGEWLKSTVSLRELARRYVLAVSQGREYSPLPRRFQDLDPRIVIDITAPALSQGRSPIVTPDPEAALGLAVTKMGDKRLPMGHGVWDLVPHPKPDRRRKEQELNGEKNVSHLGLTRYVRASDIPGKGYHWYKGPRFTLGEWTLVWLPSDWTLQEHFWPLYDPKNADQEWEYYISAKFTGPAYPHGDPNQPNGLFIDRIVLIRVDDQ